MSEPKRLSSLADVTGATLRPTYDPARHGHGIGHLGIGAFHRAHQADYTDAALAAAGGDWRIVGASLRSVELADALNPQNGLYTRIEREASELRARLIGSIERVIAASRAPKDLMTSLIDRRTRIVTMTGDGKGLRHRSEHDDHRCPRSGNRRRSAKANLSIQRARPPDGGASAQAYRASSAVHGALL